MEVHELRNVSIDVYDIDEIDVEYEYVEDLSIEDIDYWSICDESDEYDWIHGPTSDVLSVKRAETPYEGMNWVVCLRRNEFVRYAESEDEAVENAISWMYEHPYSHR